MLLAVRHGQTDWNAAGRAQGRSDQPLNSVGIAQAQVNARTIGAVIGDSGLRPEQFAIHSSPLLRARQSATIICDALGDVTFGVDERLIEMAFGEWEGLTAMEMKNRDPELRRARKKDRWNIPPPGGESFADLHRRTRQFIESSRFPAIIVTHLGVIRTLSVLLAGRSEMEAVALDVPNDAVYRFDGGQMEVCAAR